MGSDPTVQPPGPTRPTAGGVLHTAMAGLSLLAVGLVLYRNFVFGGNTLLYKDIGADSINVFYPYYILFSNYLRTEGLLSWSFHVGMGHNLFPLIGYLLFDPVVWLPREVIAHALVYQHLLKAVITGLLFFKFLQLRKLNYTSSLLGALMLAFSAFMCMGSCWYVQSDEVLCFAGLLFAAEESVGRGRWLYLVLAVALIGFLGAIHLYLCALLLLLYVPVRLIGRYSWQPLPILRTCVLLAAAATLGVGLAAIATFPNFHALLNSPRGSGPTSLTVRLSSLPMFGFESALHYLTAALRPFANDILGSGSDFRGWHNYLEAPVSYCGLLCLIIFPQVFVGATWRQRILYALFVMAVLIPIVFPWFRYLFWLFQGDYYRVFSLFSVLGIIALSMIAFSRYLERRTLNLWVLGVTVLLLVGVLYFPSQEAQALINPALRQTVAIFLLVYACLLTVGRVFRRQKIAGWILVGLVAIELIYLNRSTVSGRPTVAKQELKERVGYNDYTVDAIRDIKATDDSFFRVTKTWSSSPAIYATLNDALVFGYYGTASYSSFNNLSYIKFLMAVDAIGTSDLQARTQWSRGLIEWPLLSTFACEKYVLTENPVFYQTLANYETIKRYDRIYLFRNRSYLPLGLAYTRYIPEDLFLQLTTAEKSEAMMQAVVLSENIAREQGLSSMSLNELQPIAGSTSAFADTIAERRATSLTVSSFQQTRIEGTISLRERSMLVFQMPFDPGWRARVDEEPASALKVNVGLVGLALDAGQHRITLQYRPPFRDLGGFISLLSCAMLGLSLWRWPRIQLPE